ncbi:8320_t:CDS:2 [Gigaspora margarita]|uniref:8320_t:CDS:1 n=1 Tax=Gigaspora margarita TaxID=4874 RepID=A0ABM8VZX8_GIGMA|nr:8320_t:CDS:2 [Gigaspora margarita]
MDLNRERKREKRATETSEEREAHLTNYRSRYQKRRKQELAGVENDGNEQIRQDSGLNIREMRRESELNIDEQQIQHNIQDMQNNITTSDKPLSATVLSESDRELLSFPSVILVMGECCQCYSDKSSPKRFSGENNMDPGEVPEELQGLTEVEEMLIAQVFPVSII